MSFLIRSAAAKAFARITDANIQINPRVRIASAAKTSQNEPLCQSTTPLKNIINIIERLMISKKAQPAAMR